MPAPVCLSVVAAIECRTWPTQIATDLNRSGRALIRLNNRRYAAAVGGRRGAFPKALGDRSGRPGPAKNGPDRSKSNILLD